VCLHTQPNNFGDLEGVNIGDTGVNSNIFFIYLFEYNVNANSVTVITQV